MEDKDNNENKTDNKKGYGDDEKIRILSADDDEMIKTVGEVFANESSRAILKLLSNNDEMTINQISTGIDISIPLVSHHLKKMQETGLVTVSRVGKSVKGQQMKYYSATNKSLLIMPPEKKEGHIMNTVKRFSKFVAIALAGLVSWAVVRPTSEMPLSVESGTRVNNVADTPEIEQWTSADESAAESELQNESPLEQTAPEPPPPEMTAEPDTSFGDNTELHVDSDVGDAANTGSVVLDRTVYPEPWSEAGGASAEQLLISILVPITVIVCGIIIERLITLWLRKRRAKSLM